jgi:hypothetical protein
MLGDAGADTDRELIRSLARRLAEDGPEASRLRAAISQSIAGEPPKRGASSPPFDAPRWLALISISPHPERKGARSRSDALPVGHQHHQQRRETGAVRRAASVDGRTTRRESLHRLADGCQSGVASWRNQPASVAASSKPGSPIRKVPQALFAGGVLPFDERAGHVWARVMADGKMKGRARSTLDMIIAAVAEAKRLCGGHQQSEAFYRNRDAKSPQIPKVTGLPPLDRTLSIMQPGQTSRQEGDSPPFSKRFFQPPGTG